MTERFFGKVKFYIDSRRSGNKESQKTSGYGFLIRLSDNQNFFFHISQIRPTQQSCRPVVYAGEYVEFEVAKGLNGDQANNITGLYGGTLMCESRNINKKEESMDTSESKVNLDTDQGEIMNDNI
jgi:cold shock CspA family protein